MQDAGKEDYLRPSVHNGLDWIGYSFTHHSFSFDSPLCSSITPPLSHSRLKTYQFHKSYLPVSLLPPGLPSRTFAHTVSSQLLSFYFQFSLFFVSVPCARLGWSYRQLLNAHKYIVSIVSFSGKPERATLASGNLSDELMICCANFLRSNVTYSENVQNLTNLIQWQSKP